MKVAKKSPASLSSRATITLPREIYHKIDDLRGKDTRSAWLVRLVEEEEQRRSRQRLADSLQEQYTDEVCRETLVLNEEFPIHEG